MIQCPVCGTPHSAAPCPGCDFDVSCDYESFPTLWPIAADLRSIAARKTPQKADGKLHCPNCGSNLFHYLLKEQEFACSACLTTFTPRRFFDLVAVPTEASMIQPQNMIAVGDYHTVVLRSNGTVAAIGRSVHDQADINNWGNIISVAAGGGFSLGLCKDGTVVSAGTNWGGNVSSWQGITAITAKGQHAMGLRQDGTVLYAGPSEAIRQNVPLWRNITAIAIGFNFAVGLQADGIVITAGKVPPSAPFQIAATKWRDIVAISAGWTQIAGLRADGTVMVHGSNSQGECDVRRWTDIAAIAAGTYHTIGLRKDGTIVMTGMFSHAQKLSKMDPQWSDIIAIAAGHYHAVGLRADNTLVAFGNNDWGQCDVAPLNASR